MVKTAKDFIRIGQRHGTTDVLEEARQTKARWSEDMASLDSWGWGAERFDRLAALTDELSAQYQKALAQRGAKRAATPEQRAIMGEARSWSERGLSILDDLIEEDEEIAITVEALGSLPDLSNPSQIHAFATGIMGIMMARRGDLIGRVANDAFFAAGQTTIDALMQSIEDRTQTKDAKLAGTAQLNELDGRVHTFIARINRNARRALRDLGKPERAVLYKFHVLTATPASTDDAPQAPGGAPQPNDGTPAPPA